MPAAGHASRKGCYLTQPLKLAWDVLFSEEVACRTLLGDRIERTQPRAAFSHRKGFVKADVSVPTNAQQHQIETSCLLNGFVVTPAMQLDIRQVNLTVKTVDILFRDVYLAKKMLVQPTFMTLGAIRRESVVLIEPKHDDVAEVQILFLMQSNQFAIGADRCRSRRSPRTVFWPRSVRSRTSLAII